MAAENKIPNFYEIQRVSEGYDTYIIGRFRQPGLYVLGVMDLEDSKAWRGGVSDLVLYFAITPEEYAWLKTDRPRLDALARRLQTELPRSRFAAGIANYPANPEEFYEKCRQMLKCDRLEGDGAFEEWKQLHPFQKKKQPRTPVTDARHELAEFQRGFDREKADEKERKEEARRQRTLANRLLEQEAFFAGMDLNSPGGVWPGLEYISGDVHLFSTEENAVTACEYYKSCLIFEYQAQRVEKSQYRAFFENCEALGIQRFRVDDGIEPVELQRAFFQPDSEQSWLEEHNQGVRNAMLRSVEVSSHVRKNQAQLKDPLRKNLVGCMVTWRCRMLQELGGTLFYVPCALPREMNEKLAADLVFTKKALAWLKERLEQEKRPRSAFTGPHFAGRVASVDNPRAGKLPLRLLTDQGQKRWLVGFTSARQCRAFLEKQQQGDTMVVLTFDELFEQTEGLAGMIVDVMALGVQVLTKDMEQCVRLREQEKAAIELRRERGPNPMPAAVPKPEENAKAPKEAPQPAPEQPKPAEKPEKRGLLSRLFRRKR